MKGDDGYRIDIIITKELLVATTSFRNAYAFPNKNRSAVRWPICAKYYNILK